MQSIEWYGIKYLILNFNGKNSFTPDFLMDVVTYAFSDLSWSMLIKKMWQEASPHIHSSHRITPVSSIGIYSSLGVPSTSCWKRTVFSFIDRDLNALVFCQAYHIWINICFLVCAFNICTESYVRNTVYPRIVLGKGSANERRRYFAMSPLVGWAHTQNGPSYLILAMGK